MAKIVKKTYGKKIAWESGPSHAFDQAKLQTTKISPSKVIRPSIWAKVPLIETFSSESPPRPKKKVGPIPLSSQGEELVGEESAATPPKKGKKKRKFEDPFGFGDIEDEVAPAEEYISPKKRKLDEKSPKKKAASPGKIKKKALQNSSAVSALISGVNISPKKGGRPPKVLNGESPLKIKNKVGRPPKNSLTPSPKKLLIKSPKKIAKEGQDGSPKKVGRPRKSDSQSSPEKKAKTDSPKKRGRPPKNADGSSPSKIALIDSPKKRGRPPKNSIALVSPAKAEGESPKKRGRPPKDKSALSSPKKVDTGSPRKVGRPPKSDSIFGLPQRSESGSPKKRGRPPKSQSIAAILSPSKKSENDSPKKRGRPPKSPKADTASSPFKTGEVKSPKKRGRPPKSLSEKLESGSPEKLGLPLSSPEKVAATSPKKRGRPPKSPVVTSGIASPVKQGETPKSPELPVAVASPKKRGRPPKSPVVTNGVASPAKQNQTPNSPQLSVGVASPKKRGRPPKVVTPTAEQSGTNSEALLIKPFIKSPAAKELFSDPKLSDSTNSQTSVSEDSGPVVKRKRGRPPKSKTPVTSASKDPVMLEDNSTATSSSQSQEDSSGTQNSVATENTETQGSPSAVQKRVTFSAETQDNEDETQEESMPSSRASTASACGSPFKWFLKNNEKTLSPRKVAQLRRISVLPTCTPQNDSEQDEMDIDPVPFGLSWAMQPDDSAVRVSKDEKELFTIVRNTKQAQESVEFGESQQFKDDMEYLLDGISDTNTLSTRCLSLLELASKCSKSAFRMNLRAHGTITVIFQKLTDASTNQNLALCTAAVMFMLTRDRLSIDFDKSILEMMLKLLATEENSENESSKEWTRLTTKLKNIFEKDDIKGVNNLDLEKLTPDSLARESFLSLTLQRTGSWFKDEIRLLGGLDHIVDTLVSCSKFLIVNRRTANTESVMSVRQIERCLKLLENVTVQCASNQGYLISYRDSALLGTCARLLKYSVVSLFEENSESNKTVQALWFSTMKMLLNLTHDNETASSRFCQQADVLNVLLKSALQLPGYLPEPKRFDVAVLSLGLLINLVEYSTKNLSALNAAVAPSPGSQAANVAAHQKEDHSAVEALMQLFLVRLEAAKENSGMEEDLTKLNSSLHNSSIRIGSDGLSLICGDDLDKTQPDESATDNGSAVESTSEEKTAAEKEAEQLGKALQKAGQHMEDSLIASYAALLLGLLAEDNKENQQILYEQLQDGDFGIMTHTLDKFLAFMNMTANTSNASSSEVIKRAINVLTKCKESYPRREATS
eukprot:Seg1394.14 transcript_id=Seg1394.14/GoldUCD/mRNA.D3Y31 product="Wings apart-like protein" protein_id=Seg1394.14/GoldUCD/D3Y31